MILSIYLLSVSVAAQVNASNPSDEVPFVCNSNPALTTTGGSVQVYFDPVDLTQLPPQTCQFNVHANAAIGSTITMLIWDFGDGNITQVPYCCQRQVSEMQYHAYAYDYPNTQAYNVKVIAFDSSGKSGYAQIVVNWSTPVPEYPNFNIVLLLAMLLVPVLIRRRRSVSA